MLRPLIATYVSHRQLLSWGRLLGYLQSDAIEEAEKEIKHLIDSMILSVQSADICRKMMAGQLGVLHWHNKFRT